MNKHIILLTALGLFFFSSACNQLENKNRIVIKGYVKGLNAKEVYLTDAFNWKTFLDSSQVINDQFSFSIDVPANFEPYLVSICYKNNTLKKLIYKNDILSSVKTKYVIDAFVLEPGTTNIKGTMDNTKESYMAIQSGKETTVYYRTQMMDFGYIRGSDRTNDVFKVKAFIRTNSFSYYLLKCIWNNKELYSNQELREIISLFDQQLRMSITANRLLSYLLQRPSSVDPVANMTMTSLSGEQENIIDNSSKLHLLVFWASWCSPCRIEIPHLKKMDSLYKSLGLSIVSISIDEKKEQWTQAVNSEHMKWKQFIINSTELKKIETQFDFSSIPVVILVDRHGTIIKKFFGYTQENEKNMEETIRLFLKVKN